MGEGGNFVYHEVTRGGEFVKGAPYTATAETETTQVLADGNRIVNKSSATLARDGEGRTRREEAIVHLGPLPTNDSKLAFINDPVAKTESVLNLHEQTAHVHTFMVRPDKIKVRTFAGKQMATAPGDKQIIVTTSGPDGGKGLLPPLPDLAASAKRESQQQALPDETIDGVNCEHVLTTETIPAGSIGNEHPIVITSETWASPELHLLVMRKRNDPRFGETVYRLTDIKRGEPDPSLFQIPANFKVVDDKVITLRSPGE
jgi:hypothetical protein